MNGVNSFAACVVSFIMGFILACILLIGDDPKSYKKGQVDCLTGKVKYELITNSDSSKTWQKKNEK